MHSLLENFAEVLRIVTFQPGRERIHMPQRAIHDAELQFRGVSEARRRTRP